VRIGTPSALRRIVMFRKEFGYLGEVLFSASVVASFALFVALSKEFLRIPLHVPGHSAVYVIPLMLVGKVASRSRFGGIGIGGLSGTMMAFWGLGGGFLLGIPRYLFMGAVIDVLLQKSEVQYSTVHLIAAGAFANFAKFFVGLVVASLVGIPVFFIHLGLTYSVVTHIAFGALGGILGVLALKAMNRARNHSTTG
jgi:hypothetical protein